MAIPFKLDLMLSRDGNAYPVLELRSPAEAEACKATLSLNNPGPLEYKSNGVLVRMPYAYKASVMSEPEKRAQIEDTFIRAVEQFGYSVCDAFEGETPKEEFAKDPRIIKVKGRDYKLKAGECACDGCPGTGIYHGAGGTVNGVFKGFTGPCYRCDQKGYQTLKDQKRNRYYDSKIRFVRSA